MAGGIEENIHRCVHACRDHTSSPTQLSQPILLLRPCFQSYNVLRRIPISEMMFQPTLVVRARLRFPSRTALLQSEYEERTISS
ncbi:hypothetical protein IG631_17397 [Alternaria alternata]|nr:hypothetical protein IG631_17397 [Alternaria alternata]